MFFFVILYIFCDIKCDLHMQILFRTINNPIQIIMMKVAFQQKQEETISLVDVSKNKQMLKATTNLCRFTVRSCQKGLNLHTLTSPKKGAVRNILIMTDPKRYSS